MRASERLSRKEKLRAEKRPVVRLRMWIPCSEPLAAGPFRCRPMDKPRGAAVLSSWEFCSTSESESTRKAHRQAPRDDLPRPQEAREPGSSIDQSLSTPELVREAPARSPALHICIIVLARPHRRTPAGRSQWEPAEFARADGGRARRQGGARRRGARRAARLGAPARSPRIPNARLSPVAAASASASPSRRTVSMVECDGQSWCGQGTLSGRIVRGDAVMRMEDDAHMYRVHVPEVHRIVRPRSELPLWATVLRHSIDPVRPSEARRRGRPRCGRG